MIVAMRKLTLLCVESERDEALKRLRELGVVHLAPVQPPAGGDLEEARRYLDHVRRALDVLPRRAAPSRPGPREAEALVEDIWKLIHRRQDMEDEIEQLGQERRRIEPFGSFEPEAVKRLAESGLRVALYHAGPRDEPAAPEGAVLRVLRRGKDGIFFAVIGRGQWDIPSAASVRLPERSLNDLDGMLADAEKRLAETMRAIENHAGDYPVVADACQKAAERVRYLEAREGMGASGPVAYLSGFLPAREEKRIAAAARDMGWGIRLTDPGPDDHPPTLVENPRWIRPIRAIFEMTGLVPGYEEADISMPFLVFLSIFFAMLVGDAGYGLLFIALTALARRKFRAAPAYPFRLLYIMSATTVLWGALTGTWFGLPRENLPSISWLAPDAHVMLLCFILGAVHLSAAHLWRAARLAPSWKALAQIGWVGSTWVMFLAARFFLLDAGFPAWGLVLLVFSVGLILFFSVSPRELRREGISLAMLPLDVIGNFTDVVSYLRLFAVGTASYAVAYSFNEMVSPLLGNAFGALVGALFLFAGHALNIALCGLGILVHGVRLNTLEFSSHMGMQWTGRSYAPFKRESTGAEK